MLTVTRRHSQATAKFAGRHLAGRSERWLQRKTHGPAASLVFNASVPSAIVIARYGPFWRTWRVLLLYPGVHVDQRR
jgi:hypothetical protein